MKRILSTFTVCTALGLVGMMTGLAGPAAVADSNLTTAGASEQVVTFVVDKMNCAMCPITVRMAMEQVDGVKSVSVDLDAKTATVVFDPSIATPEEVAKASTNAGYPARPTR